MKSKKIKLEYSVGKYKIFTFTLSFVNQLTMHININQVIT